MKTVTVLAALLSLAATAALADQTTAQAGSQTSTKSGPLGSTVTTTVQPVGGDGARQTTTVSVPTSRNTSVGVYGSTSYTQPGQGAGGAPVQGTQRGSTSTTSGGVSAQVTFP